MVVEGVEDDPNLIPFAQAGIAHQFTRDYATLMRLVGPGRHVDPVVVVQNPELRSVRGKRPDLGLALVEASEGRRELPCVVVESTVYAWGHALGEACRDGPKVVRVQRLHIDDLGRDRCTAGDRAFRGRLGPGGLGGCDQETYGQGEPREKDRSATAVRAATHHILFTPWRGVPAGGWAAQRVVQALLDSIVAPDLHKHQ